MSDAEPSAEELVHQYEYLKGQFNEMQEAHRVQMSQVLSNNDIVRAKKELWKSRAACAELSNERDALLDRIADLERASRPDSSIASRNSTERDIRLRERLLPALNEPLRLDVDPYSSSRHCGPEAIHLLAAQRLAQHEQALPKTDAGRIEREIIPPPRRSRPSKATPHAAGGSDNVVGTAPSSGPSYVPFAETSNPISAMETEAQNHPTNPENSGRALPHPAPQRAVTRTRVKGYHNDNGSRAEAPMDAEGLHNDGLIPEEASFAGTQDTISRESIMKG